MFISANFLAPYQTTDTALVFINKFGRRVKGFNVCKYLDYGVKSNVLWVLLESQVKLEFLFDNEVEATTASMIFGTAIDTLTLNCPSGIGTPPTPSPVPISITLDNYYALVVGPGTIALQWYDIIDVNNALGRGHNEVYRCLSLTNADGYPQGIRLTTDDKVVIDVLLYKMLHESDVSNRTVELNEGNTFEIDAVSNNIIAAKSHVKAINSQHLYTYNGNLDVENCTNIVNHNSDIKLKNSNNCSFADVGTLDLSALGVFEDIFVNTSTTIGKDGIEDTTLDSIVATTTLLAYQNKVYQKLSGTLASDQILKLKNIGSGEINAEFTIDIASAAVFGSNTLTVQDNGGDVLAQINSGFVGSALKFKYDTITKKFFRVPDSTVNSRRRVDITVLTNPQTSFTNVLPTIPKSPELSLLVVNGQVQSYGVGNDYTITNRNLTWISSDFTLNTSDKIYIIYE